VLRISDYVRRIETSPFHSLAGEAPWALTGILVDLLTRWMRNPPSGYAVSDGIAVHETATIEEGAVVKAPTVVGARAFVAAHAYVRGAVYLGEGCIVGPSVELKTCVMFPRSKVAHLSFVGDSILGEGVNCEAGCVIANHRNERDDKRIRIRLGAEVIDTGVEKFGALLGDGVRVGANAVIAPGAILAPGTIVPRLALIEQTA
jgi:UDP-N-acetylglucosamine diphosphorylase / glucose-1-phosphate thymidylyltransferase / UDP-N-acetylgalactosamine diphosphorylase / glucosamine-1-phosphate N-acetyltransferase / galactosamine-1-phosphate N-acetyltransferase